MTTETAPTPAPAAGGRGGNSSGRGVRSGEPGPIGRFFAYLRAIFPRVRTYYREIIAELRKVIYPSRQQLLTYTVVVLVFVSFMTALVAGLDYGLSKAVVALFS